MDSFNLAIEQFHWLRPLWLLGLLPALAVALLLWRQSMGARNWGGLIAPELLGYLIDGEAGRSRRWLVWALFAAWLITCLALAGPSWEKRPMPVHKNQDALVIALDLSPSIVAEDLTPARLVRARLKVIDILRERRDGFTGLVAYAGDAHAVAPLTDDTGTIINLLPALHPSMMPLPGSNTEAAIVRSLELLDDGGATGGSIMLVTDGVVDDAIPTIEKLLEGRSVRLSVLGVGSKEGAPVPDPRGGFERDRDGSIVVARLPEDRLQELARDNGGRYHQLTGDGEDIAWLLGQESIGQESQKQLEREFDTWYDRGHWLVLLLLPIVLYAFRPGLLVVVLALPLLSLTPQTSYAQDWLAPWLNPDQRGQRLLLEENQPVEAAKKFEDPEWRGSALYKAGDYQAAAEAFAQEDNARADYNRGNALAKAGELEKALEAYDQALEKDPNLEDAQANKKLVEDLLEQQKQQEEQQQQDGDQQQDDQQEGEQGDQQQDQQGDQSQNQQQDSQNGDQDSQSESQQQPGEDGEPQDPSEQQQEGDDQEQQPPEQEAQGEDSEEQNQDQAEQQAEQEAAAQEEAQEQEAQEQKSEEALAGLQEDDLTDEERQAMEQWLRRVPDDPSGLLRRKFMYESQQKQRERYRREAPSSTEAQRW